MKLTPWEIDWFDLVPAWVAREAIFIKMPLMFWAGGMTIGRVVFLRKGLADSDDVLVGHELIHVWQFRQEGFFRFFRRYVGQYFKHLRSTHSHRTSYLMIDYEESARSGARHWGLHRGAFND